MMPRNGALLLGGLAAAVLVAGVALHSGKSQEPSPRATTRPVDLRAIGDSEPYWCDFVPQEALQRIANVDAWLTETRDGWGPAQGGCRVEDQTLAYPLGVELQRINTRAVIDRQLKQWQVHDPTRLPKELGYGFVVYAPGYVDDRPYIVSATFQCGSAQPSIFIDVVNVAKGRDYIADLTEIMRIAEKRYGVSRKCAPGPLK